MEHTLTTTQLANLYYIMFNVCEGSPENTDKLVPLMDELAIANNEPTYEKWFPDNEGAPMNASKEVYDEFNRMIEENEDWFDITDLFNDPNPTMESLLAYL